MGSRRVGQITNWAIAGSQGNNRYIHVHVRTVAAIKSLRSVFVRTTIVLRGETVDRATKNGERTETETGTRRAAESAFFRRA